MLFLHYTSLKLLNSRLLALALPLVYGCILMFITPGEQVAPCIVASVYECVCEWVNAAVKELSCL